MLNKDITFSLDSYDKKKFKHEVYDHKDVFYSREYIYNFKFTVNIDKNEMPINHLIIYRNGEPYNNCKIIQVGNKSYEVKDDVWIRYGNTCYGVDVVLEGGKTYHNYFYLKILQSYQPNDIRFISFATYGLHENYSMLDVIANIQTKYQIDRVLLYEHICPLTEIDEKSRIYKISETNERYDSKEIKWNYLGKMDLVNHQYRFRYMLFDTSLTENRTVLYKAVVVTTNEVRRSAIMSTIIKPNTMSVNIFTYMNTETKERYDIYGGCVGRIDAKIDEYDNPEYNGKIFQLLIDKRDDEQNYLKLLVGDDYKFEADNYHIEYKRKKFNRVQTNRDPNIFEIYGDGLATKVINEERDLYRRDNCRFLVTLYCGEDTFVSFKITPLNDNNLAVNTNKTENNIVKYSYNGESKIMDKQYLDKTVDVNAIQGYYTYNRKTENLIFTDIDTKEQHITIIPDKPKELLFQEFDYITYNDKYFFFVNLDNKGIHITRYDGVNIDKIEYFTEIIKSSLDWIKSQQILSFDKNNNLNLKFISSNGSNFLKKIVVENNDLSVIDYSDMLVNVFNDIRKQMLNYVDNLNSVTVGKVEYIIKASNVYDTLEHKFEDMGYTDFNLKFTTQYFTYQIKFPIDVKFLNKTTNVYVHFQTSMTVTCREDVIFYETNYSLGNPRFDIDIDSINLTYHYIDNGKNLIPQIGYEKLNQKYFLKFSQPVNTYTKEDYAIFKRCDIYNGGVSLYKINPEDVYGNGTKEKTFRYSDLCRLRIFMLNYKEYMIMRFMGDKCIMTVVNVELKEQISQETITTDMYFDSLFYFTKEQLVSLDDLLSSAYLYDSVKRKMYICALSDCYVLAVGGTYDTSFHNMEKSTSLSGIPLDNMKTYLSEYEFSYPLNIKNRNHYLNDIVFSEGVYS